MEEIVSNTGVLTSKVTELLAKNSPNHMDIDIDKE